MLVLWQNDCFHTKFEFQSLIITVSQYHFISIQDMTKYYYLSQNIIEPKCLCEPYQHKCISLLFRFQWKTNGCKTQNPIYNFFPQLQKFISFLMVCILHYSNRIERIENKMFCTNSIKLKTTRSQTTNLLHISSKFHVVIIGHSWKCASSILYQFFIYTMLRNATLFSYK